MAEICTATLGGVWLLIVVASVAGGWKKRHE